MPKFPVTLTVQKTSVEQSKYNLAYINPEIKLSATDFIYIDGTHLFLPSSDASVAPGSILLSKAQREFLNKAPGKSTAEIDTIDRKYIEPINVIGFGIEMINTTSIEVDANELRQQIKDAYEGFPFNNKQSLYIEFASDKVANKAVILLLTVTMLTTEYRSPYGILKEETEIALETASSRISLLNNNLVKGNFSLENLGIGGLKKEFEVMFRRAFVQRFFDPSIIKGLGIAHVKGIILHGPPGTGKTLIARQLGTLLNSKPPKIVNGPEILNKYIGESEKNIRELFKDAEEEYRVKGDNSQLHLIIFDEIDAICKRRGSDSSIGVGDQVVNQLLSKIDGVQRLNNILVIGLTNRLDLIDDALLRPGRFEIHLEISLPDEESRFEIFKIHTKKMSGNNYLDKAVKLEYLAANTRNYTGAEIEAVVRAACGYALERKAQLDKRLNMLTNNTENPAQPAEPAQPTEKAANESGISVTLEDFLLALKDVKPAFGISEYELEIFGKVFYETATAVTAIELGNTMISNLKKTNLYTTTSLLFFGGMNTGKTTLAVRLALQSAFPFVKMISPDHLVGMAEYEKVNFIKKWFLDAYKSDEACIILDDLEAIMEYVPIGPRFSNLILQAIKRFIKAEKKNKLFVFGTTSEPEFIQDCGLFSCFTESLEIGPCTRGEYESLCLQNPAFREIEFTESVPIKKLLIGLPQADELND